MALEQYDYTCKICGDTFEKAPSEWFENKGLSVPTKCDDCKQSGRNFPSYEYICRVCGNTFEKAPPEWFRGKGLSEPSKCEDCKSSKPQSYS